MFAECIRKEQGLVQHYRLGAAIWLGKVKQRTGGMSTVACYRLGGNFLVSLWRLLLVESIVSVSAKVTEMLVLGCGQRIERLA
jgi:hypothetical protein